MGKEDLFYRWVELAQYEGSEPGGLDVQKRAQAAERMKELFRSHDVDPDAFWESFRGTEEEGEST
jgi:hypothetical protein